MHPLFHLLLFYLGAFLDFLRDFLIPERAPKPFRLSNLPYLAQKEILLSMDLYTISCILPERAPKPFRLSKLPYLAQKEILLSMDLYTILTLSISSKSMRRIAEPYARKFPNPSSDVGPLFTLYQDENWFGMFFDRYKTSKYEIEEYPRQYIGSDIVAAANFLVDFYKLEEIHFSIIRDRANVQESKLELISEIIDLHSSQLKNVCIESCGSRHLPLAKILKKWNSFDQVTVCFDNYYCLLLTVGITEVVFKHFTRPTIGSIWEDWNFKSLEVDSNTILHRIDLIDCIRRWMNSGGQQSGKTHFAARYQGTAIRNVLESVCPVETLEPWEHEKYGRIEVSYRIRRGDGRQAIMFFEKGKLWQFFHICIDDGDD